ncbi:major facilitator superfamily domain-containing protein [Rhodocollybia butyracea]|uniref:Major facilitator superfamily domain-containing protein n=1 Tax=Rhodocollybia butyracea TaxID=206335 RepID=A0A9P5PVR5_9AGAR|nr:major facilitator superfamily domain-containing protein [Rhodocollybia butyracea]
MSRSSGSDPAVNDLEKVPADPPLAAKLDVEAGKPQATSNTYGPTDGGWDAWGTVLGATLISMSTFGFVNAFGAFADFYDEIYLKSYSATVIDMVGALQVFLLYIFAGTAGAVFDAIGPRYLIPLSGVMTIFSLFMLSITKPEKVYQQFLSQSVLFSLGAGISFFPLLGLMAHWFKGKLPYAVGCLTAGASVGGVIFPIMIAKLVPKIGFGWTIRIFAFITLTCFTIGAVTIKQRRPSKPFPTSASALFDFAAFKDPCYTFLALGCWFCVFAVFNPFFYVGLSAEISNPNSSVNGYYLPILCATSIVGRVTPGLIATRVGRFNILCVSTILSTILILALWYTSFEQANLIAFAALYGLASGPFFSVTPACVAEISPIERIGARMGGTYAFMASATLAGTPISGLFIEDQTKPNFQRLILFSGIMSLVGALLLCVARFIRNKNLLAIA